MRRDALLAALVLAAGWALTLWLFPFSDERVNDLFVYRLFTVPVLDGELPYRDVFFEYPPLAAPAIALPGLLGSTEEAFRLAFAGWTLALAGAVMLLCGALAARTGGDRRRALFAAALMPLLCGALVRTHFDLAPVALLLGALVLLIDGRPRWGMAVLGMAAMTKGFPIVAAPVALAWLAPRTDRRTLLQSALALAAALAIPALIAVAFSPGGALDAVRYHAERPVQVESLPATAVNALDYLGVGEARRLSSHRSDGLEHPAAGALAGAGLLALLLLLGGLTRNQYIESRSRRTSGTRGLVLAALAAVLAFAALGKVLSPQYVLWLVPLGALAFAWRMHALAAALGAAALLTQLEFPSRYLDLVDREPFPLALVALRNLALLVALGLALRALQPGREEHLLDRGGPTVRVSLDEHRVQPRVLG